MSYKAYLFDLNGTMINDMAFHIKAWYRILNRLGANISREKTKEECYGKNNELLERIFPGRFSEPEKNRISFEKEKQYQEEFGPRMQMIKGLGGLLKRSKEAGIKLAIGSAAIRFNVDFVIDGLQVRNYFDAIISADDVKSSKPDPETYIKCAANLGIASEDCLVFEDAPKGAESAMKARMNCVIITTQHTREEFRAYTNIIAFIEDYDNFTLV